MAFFEACFCGTGGPSAGWGETAAAAAWAILVLSPMVHFLTFYSFWHCVCMGLAELTGYPDRFLYGEGGRQPSLLFWMKRQSLLLCLGPLVVPPIGRAFYAAIPCRS